MAITNLTGTTWVFKNTLTKYTGSSVSLQFNSFSTSFNTLSFSGSSTWRMEYNNGSTTVSVYVSNSGWANDGWKTITITGGTNATSSSLITWFEANATQVREIAYTTTTEELTSIANAIRSKTGSQSNIKYPDGFITEISNL